MSASDVAHKYSLIGYECHYGLQTMKENLVHIENRADVVCIQNIDTVNNFEPSHHTNVVFCPFVSSGLYQLKRFIVKDSLLYSPEVPEFLKRTACF